VALDPAGRVLTERRADRGLLGGMLAVPSTAWLQTAQAAALKPPLPGAWENAGEVRHVFTHFNLLLEVRRLRLPSDGGDGFVPAEQAEAAMPTVFAKAVRLARSGDRRAVAGSGGPDLAS
jgi:A/G-specific adenine glycosylase